ncbi:MAG: phosphoesterase PA-phosphatase, partial [Candidatus Saccharibacteria bacterium]|nr:phosphoesterase PA-phosphatase [Pseudorhodobacter sp.]
MRKLLLSLLIVLLPLPAMAGGGRDVMLNWYKLVLELVRHTPTYSPPVASRAFAYLGVTSYEVLATTRPQMHSLAGQLNDLSTLPAPGQGVMDEAVVMHAALAQSLRGFFGNTGPSGQQAMDRMDAALSDQIAV